MQLMCHGLLLDEGGPLGQHKSRQQKVFEAEIGTGQQLVRPTAGLKTMPSQGLRVAPHWLDAIWHPQQATHWAAAGVRPCEVAVFIIPPQQLMQRTSVCNFFV